LELVTALIPTGTGATVSSSGRSKDLPHCPQNLFSFGFFVPQFQQYIRHLSSEFSSTGLDAEIAIIVAAS
jgi:hypothetical protein